MKKNILFVLATLLIVWACQSKKTSAVSEEDRLKLANAYYTNGLYEASVQEYLDYLANTDLDAGRQANTYYSVANIYFERLNDYEKAVQYYFKIKYLFPESNLQSEVSKRVVDCLERMQKSADASRIYESEAALDKTQTPSHATGETLAEFGSRKITQGDLEFEISRLPAYIQEQIKDKNQKSEILTQLVAQELLYDKAKRMELDKNKDVIEGVYRAQKSMMAEMLLQSEMQGQVKIEPADVELFYLAHKDRYAEKDEKGNVTRQKPLAEVQQQAAQELAMDRQQQAYQKLINRLMQAEKVKVYPERVK
jgi:tetratricopeptide (TPR) repeat protein